MKTHEMSVAREGRAGGGGATDNQYISYLIQQSSISVYISDQGTK